MSKNDARRPAVSAWIPTAERMPVAYEQVLVAWRSGETFRMAIGCLIPDGRWGVDGWDRPVTHWQPLPQHADAGEKP